MKTSIQLNIEDRSGYFLSDMTSINDIDPSLLSVDAVSFRNDELIMYSISYAKYLNGLSALYLGFDNLDGQDRYVIPAPAEKNKIMLQNYTEIFDEIK